MCTGAFAPVSSPNYVRYAVYAVSGKRFAGKPASCLPARRLHKKEDTGACAPVHLHLYPLPIMSDMPYMLFPGRGFYPDRVRIESAQNYTVLSLCPHWIREEILIGQADAFIKARFCFPAHGFRLRDVKKLARSSVGF